MAHSDDAVVGHLDTVEQIQALLDACALLDRGLRDRPGALRLVGVGLSGLSDYRQLSLDESDLVAESN